ncbi:WG repeat-containing protein [Paenibacillus sp. YN15]|uniref:WG repeat-containing protein n=1 Tax=Paenibacillus sp. YN15 TaxID=1742774 RepID=UPI00215C083E|nr:WG repeat-containing protein [Paenibacillus sp. YN15]
MNAVGDFDGDGIWEAAALSRAQDGLWLTVYKYSGWGWMETGRWRWPEVAVQAFYAVPAAVNGRSGHNLVVGWAAEAQASLSVMDWTAEGPAERVRYALSAAGESGYARRAPALFPASVNTTSGQMWGYVDAGGKMRLAPVYDYAENFQNNGLAVVSKGGKNGIINTGGQFVVEPRFDSIGEFSEGRAVVSDDKGAYVIDEQGRRVTPPDKVYTYIQPYSDGRALFYLSSPEGNAAYGYLDRDGAEVIPATFMEGTDFRNGKAVVKVKDGLYRLIGLQGETLTELPYAFVGPLSEGVMAYQATDGGKYGYVNEQGAVVIAPAFTGAQPFQQGRAVVNTAEDYGANYGVIDTSGKFTIPAAGYADIRLLGQDRAALGKPIDPARPYLGTSYAISDLNGKLYSAFQYLDVQNFNRGAASAQDARSTFFIGPDGKRITRLPLVPGSGTLSFEGNLIRAQVDNRLSYLTPAGRVVWAQNTVIPLTPPYSVKELKYKPNKDYLVYYPQVEGITPPSVREQVNRRLAELSKVKPVPASQQLESSYTGDFQVVFYRGRLLQLLLEGYDYPFGAAHGMPSRVYPPIDLGTGRFYELKDLFKPDSDYLKVLSAIVKKQIASGAYPYVWPDNYKGISADQLFYVTENDLHLLFAPYEIAPYAAGFPEFTVPFTELDPILDKNGAFWRSFHPQV